ncbi:MAG: hypothetical protein LBB94_05795, partial [Clostridiales bacterium]|nr:hypothetical protein [Clostridiales bacterium]
MICKKCKTAVSENDRKCPNCRASLRMYSNHQFWLAALIIILLLIIFSIYIMYTQMRVNQPYTPENQAVQTNQPPEDAQPGSGANAGNNGITAQPIPVFSADPGKTSAEIEKMVQNIAASAEKYRAAYSETNEFVSSNGYLYDFPAEAYISVKDFTDVEGFDPAYADEGAMILYVKTGDMPNEITFGMDSDKLAVFVLYPSGSDFMASNGNAASLVKGSVIQDVLNR